MATNQDFAYPSSADVTITGIGNPTGQPVPADAVYVGGKNPSGNLQGATVDANGALLVSPLTTSSTVTVVQPTGTNLHAVIDSSALPTGASTSALQTTGNTSLSAIQTSVANIPPQGQALAAASTPVVLTAAQVATLTPLTTVTVTQATGSNLHTQIDAGSASIGTVGLNAGTQSVGTVGLNAGANNVGSITNITGTVTLPTGASTSALQTTGNTSLATIATNTTGASTSANQTNGTQVSQITPVKGTLTDNSGSTSATPSTSTQIMAANSSRKYLLIENLSTTVNIYINFTSAATAGSGSYLLLPGGSIVQETGFVSTEAVTVLSTTASVPYTAKQA